MSAAAKSVRRRLYARDRGRCVYCGTPLTFVEATFDHRVPRSRGGKTDEVNLAVCCLLCNLVEGDMTDGEWMATPKQDRFDRMIAVRNGAKGAGTW